MAQEARQRTYQWHDPLPHADRGKQMTGIDYMKAFVDGEIPPAPISQTLGFRVVEVEVGHAIFECTPDEFHYNPIGTVHGGLAATLLDSALGCAIHTTMAQGMAYTTVQLNVNYLRAMTQHTGTVRCEAHVIHSGRSTATAEAKITDDAGKIYAHGTTTCLVFPIPE